MTIHYTRTDYGNIVALNPEGNAEHEQVIYVLYDGEGSRELPSDWVEQDGSMITGTVAADLADLVLGAATAKPVDTRLLKVIPTPCDRDRVFVVWVP